MRNVKVKHHKFEKIVTKKREGSYRRTNNHLGHMLSMQT